MEKKNQIKLDFLSKVGYCHTSHNKIKFVIISFDILVNGHKCRMAKKLLQSITASYIP